MSSVVLDAELTVAWIFSFLNVIFILVTACFHLLIFKILLISQSGLYTQRKFFAFHTLRVLWLLFCSSRALYISASFCFMHGPHMDLCSYFLIVHSGPTRSLCNSSIPSVLSGTPNARIQASFHDLCAFYSA
ncbi:hypothetical protein F5146DRAFT_138568 [Armillaria mellea]|nr:hypothetical protein F5146DRAFT_138568 [Armillaria mellea]